MAGERDILLGFADNPPPADRVLRGFNCDPPAIVLSSSGVSFSTVVDPRDVVTSPPDITSRFSTLGCTCPKALANTLSNFLPRLPDLPLPGEESGFSSWGLCLAMLAFVGEAKDGLCGKVVASLRTGIRLGVAVASTGIDVVGDILRLFEGEDSIEKGRVFSLVSHIQEI